jgi:GAF domain-containing protein
MIVEAKLAAESGIWAKLLETRNTIILDYQKEKQLKPLPGTDPAISALVVPIFGSDQIIGCILWENFKKKGSFEPAEIRLIETVASTMVLLLKMPACLKRPSACLKRQNNGRLNYPS